MTVKGFMWRAIQNPWVVIGGPLACLIALTCIPVGREKATFLAVTSSDRFDDNVFSSRLLDYPKGDFVIHDGKLYLKVQGIQRAILVTSFARRYKWTISKVRTFRLGHPELESYWPDRARADAGIAWIRAASD